MVRGDDAEAVEEDGERRCELHYNNKTYMLICRLPTPTTPTTPSSSSSPPPPMYLPTPPPTSFTPASLPALTLHLGLPAYLLLTPHPARRTSRNESALLLSTLVLAAGAVACGMALLVPFGAVGGRQYWGRTVGGGAGGCVAVSCAEW